MLNQLYVLIEHRRIINEEKLPFHIDVRSVAINRVVFRYALLDRGVTID